MDARILVHYLLLFFLNHCYSCAGRIIVILKFVCLLFRLAFDKYLLNI